MAQRGHEIALGIFHAFKFISLFPQAGKRVLHGVFRIFRIAKNRKGHAVEARSQLEIFLFEALRVHAVEVRAEV